MGCGLRGRGVGAGGQRRGTSTWRPPTVPPPVCNERLVQRTLLFGLFFLRVFCSLDTGGGVPERGIFCRGVERKSPPPSFRSKTGTSTSTGRAVAPAETRALLRVLRHWHTPDSVLVVPVSVPAPVLELGRVPVPVPIAMPRWWEGHWYQHQHDALENSVGPVAGFEEPNSYSEGPWEFVQQPSLGASATVPLWSSWGERVSRIIQLEWRACGTDLRGVVSHVCAEQRGAQD